MIRAMIVGACAFILTMLFAHGRVTPYDNYVLFADALLHGHLWIHVPGPYIDAVTFEGYRYIVNDPVPGLLLVPFVAIWHTAMNQTFLACVLAGIATGAGWQLARNLGCSTIDADWLAAFLLLGTDLLWCAMLGDVWYIAHVSCVAFTLLALAECSGKRRPWLVGLWFALACGSRFPVVLTLPAFAFWLASGFAEPDARPRRIVPFLLTLAPFTLLWVGYNEARWHVPWDIGHSVFYAQDVNVGADGGAPFSLRYFPYQLWSYFVQPLHVQNMPPYIVPDQYGQALTWTSPALLLAFFARGRRALIVSVWCAAVLAAGPAFLYYVNGFVQFGMRHALDFEAFLFVLMALAARRGLRWYWNALITYSALAGIYGSWYWNTFFRTKY